MLVLKNTCQVKIGSFGKKNIKAKIGSFGKKNIKAFFFLVSFCFKKLTKLLFDIKLKKKKEKKEKKNSHYFRLFFFLKKIL
jgi:hypothetical protein